jgi:hypothetical protein
MIARMNTQRWARVLMQLPGLIWTAAMVLCSPLSVLAQDEPKIYDARLEGYENNYTLDAGGTGLTWLLLVVLGALCIGVLFKSAKRTHLD